jgi:hypothetical protein
MTYETIDAAAASSFLRLGRKVLTVRRRGVMRGAYRLLLRQAV